MEAVKPYNPGILEVYTGPMKSGKTSRMVFRLKKLQYHEDVEYIAFKPSLDVRSENIESREGHVIPSISIPANNPNEILNHIEPQHKVIVFSEAQFFSKEICTIVEYLLSQHKNVIVEGLNLDFRAEPFGAMPYFLARADHIEVLTAVCDCMVSDVKGKLVRCQNPATRTQRLIEGKPAAYDSPIILIGDKEIVGMPSQSYETRCFEHHVVPGHPWKCNV
jgi:thymidine kinase